ncbi:MAG: damage-inducible protein DinB [Owenweeksia sp.]|nr:damage-inducible protein DinB [Owenweeksia sp.]MBF97992.1 damage-inducible protein DinB [Owenweeksia sp.]HBF20847.1 damage-inducible protein DinB [Cryomorphaceae bacterium]HCQ16146.1 damage-inducible protein DinB [Cryomorphaceae bacterium]|tara:strand:- start:1765 stop:2205 length:441 start_codon:yes stop_codon:yes gene_type:complete
MKELLELLEYNFWANDQFILRLKEQDALPDSIHRQVSHLLSAHRIWLHRVNGRGTLPSVWGEVDLSSWEGINIELYNETTDLVKSNALDRVISYRNSKGELFEDPLRAILFHVINHSTHHRAQIALLMRQNQILPPVSDYIFYLRS